MCRTKRYRSNRERIFASWLSSCFGGVGSDRYAERREQYHALVADRLCCVLAFCRAFERNFIGSWRSPGSFHKCRMLKSEFLKQLRVCVQSVRSFVRSCFAEEASASIDSFNVFLSESSTDSEDEESTGPKVAFHIHRPPKAWRSKRVERRRKREPRWPVRPRGTVSAHKQLVVGVYHGRLTGSTSCMEPTQMCSKYIPKVSIMGPVFERWR